MRGHTSLEHVERDLSVQGRWAQWEDIHHWQMLSAIYLSGRWAQCIKDIYHWNMLRQIYLYRVGELNAISSDEWKYLRTVWVLFVIPKTQALKNIYLFSPFISSLFFLYCFTVYIFIFILCLFFFEEYTWWRLIHKCTLNQISTFLSWNGFELFYFWKHI